MTPWAFKTKLPTMCLLAVAYNRSDQYPLVVSANRDEFYARPSEALHWWPDEQILAGRDLEANGTWMGVSRTGRFAAVTNIRRGTTLKPDARSRGLLVSEFLYSDGSAEHWAETLKHTLHLYNGFNLLIFDGATLLYINNLDNQITRLDQGVYAMSNHLLDTPWPKVEHARRQMETLIDAGALSTDSLLQLLHSRETYAPELLPDTGISREIEQLLSAPFIVAENYGTRASTALVQSASGQICLEELRFFQGKEEGRSSYSFEPAKALVD